MGMKGAFKAAARAAFAAAGDIVTTVTYISNNGSSYDTSTGSVTPSTTSYTGIDAIPDSYSTREITNQPDISRSGNRAILPDDKKLYILVDDLTPTPKENDTVILSSENWTVIGKYKDPADALWQLQIRKAK